MTDTPDHELLIRIDEKVRAIHDQLGVMTDRVKEVGQRVGDLERDALSRKQAGNEYVTKHEFEPVQRAAYGAITVFLVAILGAVASLILKR